MLTYSLEDPDAGKDWRREKGMKGWDGWMASPTQQTWVWVGSRSWWQTGKPGVLQSMGSQSRTWLSNWTESNWRDGTQESHYCGLSVHWGQMPQTSLTDRRGPEKVTATSLRPPLYVCSCHHSIPQGRRLCLWQQRCSWRAVKGELEKVGRPIPWVKQLFWGSSGIKTGTKITQPSRPCSRAHSSAPPKVRLTPEFLSVTHTSFQQGLQGTGWPSDSALSTGRSQSDGRSRPGTVKDREA